MRIKYLIKIVMKAFDSLLNSNEYFGLTDNMQEIQIKLTNEGFIFEELDCHVEKSEQGYIKVDGITLLERNLIDSFSTLLNKIRNLDKIDEDRTISYIKVRNLIYEVKQNKDIPIESDFSFLMLRNYLTGLKKDLNTSFANEVINLKKLSREEIINIENDPIYMKLAAMYELEFLITYYLKLGIVGTMLHEQKEIYLDEIEFGDGKIMWSNFVEVVTYYNEVTKNAQKEELVNHNEEQKNAEKEEVFYSDEEVKKKPKKLTRHQKLVLWKKDILLERKNKQR